jgi:hypothetical protein
LPEYQNIPLLPGEEILFAGDFTPSPIIRSAKSGVVVTRERVAVVHPQHIFLFFKVGQAVSSTPMEDVCEVTVGRLLSVSHVRMALIFGFLGLFLLLSGGLAGSSIGLLGAIVLFPIAGVQMWLARRLGLTVCHRGGRTLSVEGEAIEHQAMVAAADIIQQLMVGQRPGKPGLVIPTPAQAAPRIASPQQWLPRQ